MSRYHHSRDFVGRLAATTWAAVLLSSLVGHSGCEDANLPTEAEPEREARELILGDGAPFVAGGVFDQVDSYYYAHSVLYDPDEQLYKVWGCANFHGDNIVYKEAPTLAGLNRESDMSEWRIALDPIRDGVSFDSEHACDPSVVKYNGRYYLYYGGLNEHETPGQTRLGVAESTDGGRTFKRLNEGKAIYESDNYVSGYGVGQPAVAVKDGWLYMVFTRIENTAVPAVIDVVRSRDVLFRDAELVRRLPTEGDGGTQGATLDLAYSPHEDEFLVVANASGPNFVPGSVVRVARYTSSTWEYKGQHLFHGDPGKFPWLFGEGVGVLRSPSGHLSNQYIPNTLEFEPTERGAHAIVLFGALWKTKADGCNTDDPAAACHVRAAEKRFVAFAERSPTVPGYEPLVNSHFQKEGNNGTVSCDTYCEGPQWGGADQVGTCVRALVNGENVACSAVSNTPTTCECSRSLTKHGNNGTVSCNTFCAGDQWGEVQGKCLAAYRGSQSFTCDDTAPAVGPELTCECAPEDVIPVKIGPRPDVFVKPGNNGTVSCARYCSGAEWGSFDDVGKCLGANRRGEEFSCDEVPGLGGQLTCECLRARAKGGNNGTMSCDGYCGSYDHGGWTGTCVGALNRQTGQEVSCETNTGFLGGHELSCLCNPQESFLKLGNNGTISCDEMCERPDGGAGECIAARAGAVDRGCETVPGPTSFQFGWPCVCATSRTKHGNNGTVSCDQFCADPAYQGWSGACIAAFDQARQMSLPCDAGTALTGAELTCECTSDGSTQIVPLDFTVVQ